MFTLFARPLRSRHVDPVNALILRELHKVNAAIATLNRKVDTLMIDTSKLLAQVAREQTDVASLRALAVAQSQTMATLSQQLKDALAANDPVALAQVQADLDKASTDLSVDNDATEAALAANVQPAAGPQT